MPAPKKIPLFHRLSTILHLDRLIVLIDGAITENGAHQELLKLNGFHPQLWLNQSGGFLTTNKTPTSEDEENAGSVPSVTTFVYEEHPNID